MNSSTDMPSILGGRLTRFCFPLMKMYIYSSRLRHFSAFSAAVSFRFCFAISNFRNGLLWVATARARGGQPISSVFPALLFHFFSISQLRLNNTGITRTVKETGYDNPVVIYYEIDGKREPSEQASSEFSIYFFI